MKNSSTFLNRAARNMTFSGLGTLSTVAIGLLFAGLTVRYLGAARAGFIMLLSALTNFSSLLGDFGFGTAAVRNVAMLSREREFPRCRRIVSSLSTLNAGSAVVIALPIVMFFGRVFTWSRLDAPFREDAFWATVYTAITYVITQGLNAWRSVYTAQERFDVSSGLNTAFGLVNGVTGIAILHVMPTMASISLVRLGVALVRAAADWHYMRRLLGGAPWPGWDWGELKPLLSFGAWVYVTNIGNFLLGRVNSFTLTTLLGAAVLPYYEMPQRIFNSVHGALYNQTNFLFPMLASYGESAKKEIEARDDRMRWIIALASAAVYCGIALAALPLLTRLVNADFANKAAGCLVLACVQGFFEAQVLVSYNASWAIGSGAPNAIKELAHGAIVALSALYLIPRLGYTGAAVAQLWVAPAVILHTLMVRRMVAPESSAWRWLRAYVSPACMVVTWTVVTRSLLTLSRGPSLPLVIASIAAGALIAVPVVWFVETRIFVHQRRWATLERAASALLSYASLGRVTSGAVAK